MLLFINYNQVNSSAIEQAFKLRFSSGFDDLAVHFNGLTLPQSTVCIQQGPIDKTICFWWLLGVALFIVSILCEWYWLCIITTTVIVIYCWQFYAYFTLDESFRKNVLKVTQTKCIRYAIAQIHFVCAWLYAQKCVFSITDARCRWKTEKNFIKLTMLETLPLKNV